MPKTLNGNAHHCSLYRIQQHLIKDSVGLYLFTLASSQTLSAHLYMTGAAEREIAEMMTTSLRRPSSSARLCRVFGGYLLSLLQIIVRCTIFHHCNCLDLYTKTIDVNEARHSSPDLHREPLNNNVGLFWHKYACMERNSINNFSSDFYCVQMLQKGCSVWLTMIVNS